MTREERILKTWQMYARNASRYVRIGAFRAYMYIDADESVLPYVGMGIPTEKSTVDACVFTFEACGWTDGKGNYWEWWNVLCEGRIIAYFPYVSEYRENML